MQQSGGGGPRHNQKGNAAIMMAVMLAAVGGGFAVYMTETNNRAVGEKQTQKTSEATGLVNTGNLAAVASLLRFPTGVAPAQQRASNPTYVPAIYPDPYLYTNAAAVRLVAVKGVGTGGRWSSDQAGSISIAGVNPVKVTSTDLDAVFGSGKELAAKGAAYSASSKVNLVGIKKNGLAIQTITVTSSAALSGANNKTTNHFDAEIEVPTPPAPEISSTTVAGPVLSWGQQVTINYHGYGIMSQVVAYPSNNQNAKCNLKLPAAASSILNTIQGGFSLGSCTFTMQPYDTEASPPNPDWGYMTIYVAATGPGGTSTSRALVPVYKPPQCRFPTATYFVSETQNVAIGMQTTGTITGAGIQLPVNDTQMNRNQSAVVATKNLGWHLSGVWTPGTAVNFNPGDQYGGAAGIPGRVTGPGTAPGTWVGCTNTTNINISQSVCWDHADFSFHYLFVCYNNAVANVYIKWTTYAKSKNYNNCNGVVYPEWDYTCSGAPEAPRDEGCFSPDTELALATGGSRRIDRLLANDLLLNPLTGRGSRIRRVVKGPEAEPMIELGYGGHVVRVTSKHAMLTTLGVKPAAALQQGDQVLGDDRHYHQLDLLRRLPVQADQQVYNVELATEATALVDHVVVADGIVTGDLGTQEALAKGASWPPVESAAAVTWTEKEEH